MTFEVKIKPTTQELEVYELRKKIKSLEDICKENDERIRKIETLVQTMGGGL